MNPVQDLAHHSSVDQWIWTERKNLGSQEATHLTMTGGRNAKFRLDDSAKLYGEMARVMNSRKAPGQHAEAIPPITERITPDGFPMFCDFDFELHCPSLSALAVNKIMEVICNQLVRFFPCPENEKTFYAIVCSKYREIQANEACEGRLERGDITDQMVWRGDGTYKLGLHVHWPFLLVNKEQALQIRLSMLSALYVVPITDWQAFLGPEDLFNWEKILDESVYNTGLRLPGCFKSKPCTLCRGKDRCLEPGGCAKQNNRHIIEPVFYDFNSGFSGAERVDESHDWYKRVTSSTSILLKYTTVRSDEKAKDGYFKAYPGCPQLSKSVTSAASGGKRKATGALDAPQVKDKDAKKMKPITDSKQLDVIRRHLVKHCSKYKDSKITAKGDDDRVFASLSGDESTFCLNKNDYHGSSHVYMQISRGNQNKAFNSVMRCFCPKKTEWSTSRGRCHIKCSDYHSKTESLEAEEVACLFPKTKAGVVASHANYRVSSTPWRAS